MSDALYIVKEKLASLEAALLQATPNMPTLLRDIHRTLAADADLVTLLSEEECAILVKGLVKQTNTSIAVSTVKASKKSASKMTVDDL